MPSSIKEHAKGSTFSTRLHSSIKGSLMIELPSRGSIRRDGKSHLNNNRDINIVIDTDDSEKKATVEYGG
jgi:hypothetical protein